MNKYKWVFTPWTSLTMDRYERYLEKKAMSGWVLEKTKCIFQFSRLVKSEVTKTRYCLDYQQKAESDYMSILNDDGWNLISHSNGWYLWKKNYEQVRPSLYTDKQSIIDKNTKLLYIHGLLLITQIPIFIIFSKAFFNTTSLVWTIFTYFYFIILILLSISAVFLLLANRNIKRSIR